MTEPAPLPPLHLRHYVMPGPAGEYCFYCRAPADLVDPRGCIARAVWDAEQGTRRTGGRRKKRTAA